MTWLVRTASLLLLLSTMSCQWWSDPLGRFDGTFTGDESFTAEWEASFALGYLLLSGEEGFVRFEPMPDEAGRYALGPRGLPAPGDTLVAEAGFRILTAESSSYRSSEGFLVVESASELEVRGSVAMSAVSTLDGSRNFDLDGRFVAEYVEPRY